MESQKPSLLVVGKPNYAANEIETLRRKGFKVHILDLEGKSLDEALEALKQQASYHRYQALAFFSFIFRPLDSRVLGPFLPHLKLVTGLGAGFDKVDIDYLTSNKIIYCNSPVAVSDPTATSTVMLILQTIRGATELDRMARSGAWERGEARLERTIDVRDVTVGIIGLGMIGKLVQSKVEALGMKVIYNNRRPLPPSEEGNAVFHTLPSLLAHADLISLHCPLTPETYHLLSEPEFKLMKDGVFIVNTSRGPVIDEEALTKAMEKGKVSRVGLDVFEQEPKIHPYLKSSARTVLTPHFAALTRRGALDGEREVLENFKAWAVNGRGNTPVNLPPGGWHKGLALSLF